GVSIGDLLAASLGPARAAVASAVAGRWERAVVIGVRSREEALARKRSVMLRTMDSDVFEDRIADHAEGAELQFAANVDGMLGRPTLDDIDLVLVDILASKPGFRQLDALVSRLQPGA